MAMDRAIDRGRYHGCRRRSAVFVGFTSFTRKIVWGKDVHYKRDAGRVDRALPTVSAASALARAPRVRTRNSALALSATPAWSVRQMRRPRALPRTVHQPPARAGA